MRRQVSAGLAVAGAVAAVLAAAPSASAETNAPALYASCEGNRIAASDVTTSGGAVLSTVEVYASGSYRTATLCVRNLHRGSHYGQNLYTTVNIDGVYDRGDYSYYAGAIRVRGAYYGGYGVHKGDTNPSNPSRTYVCLKVVGRTADDWAPTTWICWDNSVSR